MFRTCNSTPDGAHREMLRSILGDHHSLRATTRPVWTPCNPYYEAEHLRSSCRDSIQRVYRREIVGRILQDVEDAFPQYFKDPDDISRSANSRTLHSLLAQTATLRNLLAFLERVQSGGEHYIHMIRWEMVKNVLERLHFWHRFIYEMVDLRPTEDPDDATLAHILNLVYAVKNPHDPDLSHTWPSSLRFEHGVPINEAELVKSDPNTQSITEYERMLRCSLEELSRVCSPRLRVQANRDRIIDLVHDKLDMVHIVIAYHRDIAMCGQARSLPYHAVQFMLMAQERSRAPTTIKW